MRKLTKFFLNRIGWAGAAANALLLLFGIYQKGIGNRSFHLYHEPWPIQLFVLLNLPAVFISGVISDLTQPLQQYTYFIQVDNLTFFTTVLFSVLQWLAVGYFVSDFIGHRRRHNNGHQV